MLPEVIDHGVRRTVHMPAKTASDFRIDHEVDAPVFR